MVDADELAVTRRLWRWGVAGEQVRGERGKREREREGGAVLQLTFFSKLVLLKARAMTSSLRSSTKTQPTGTSSHSSASLACSRAIPMYRQ